MLRHSGTKRTRDLGIEPAQITQKSHDDRPALKARIRLRSVIIFFFMCGALSGAWLYRYAGFHAFVMPVILLFIALIYDIFRIAVKRFYHKRNPFKT